MPTPILPVALLSTVCAAEDHDDMTNDLDSGTAWRGNRD